ncbi:MAG: hypothetical protein JXR37_01570 [Kiritimatiellae bacterium]|nr:hypothetical protein [Kiritimatiellia bacterium]
MLNGLFTRKSRFRAQTLCRPGALWGCPSGTALLLGFCLAQAVCAAEGLDPILLGNRQRLWQQYNTGQITPHEMVEIAREMELKAPRSKYVSAILDMTVKRVDPKTGKTIEMPAFMRSGAEARWGRGILSDEDIMLRPNLTMAEADEAYQRAVAYLRGGGAKPKSDMLLTRTADDVIIWKPTAHAPDPRQLGHMETFIQVRVQEGEYAPFAKPGGTGQKTIGLTEETVLDNLNKGGPGYGTHPAKWLDEPDMTHKLWDEFRVTAKDTHRSMKAAGLDKLDPETYRKYVALAEVEKMPCDYHIFPRGASVDEMVEGLVKEQAEMRQIMKKALAQSIAERHKDAERVLDGLVTGASLGEMRQLRGEALVASRRMERLAENYRFLSAKYPDLMAELDFPADYLAKLNKTSARFKKALAEPQILLGDVFARYLRGRTRNDALKALLDDELADLPEAAKGLQKELAGVASLDIVGLEPVDPEDFLAHLKKKFPQLDVAFEPGDEAVGTILKRLYASPDDDLVVLFGQKAASKIGDARRLATPAVKDAVRKTVQTRRLLLGQVDEAKGYAMFGDEGIGGLAFEGVLAVASGLAETASIMDQNLPPEEERRRLMNAWVTALPVVGDFAQSLIDGGEAYYEGDGKKAVRSGLYVVIGVGGLVPGAQVPALVAGLGMVTWDVGESAWAFKKDRDVIWAWFNSAEWDEEKYVIVRLVDANDNRRVVPPSPFAFEQLITEGTVGYRSGLAGTTIRDSVCDFAERNLLAHDETFKSMRLAFKNLYPEFDLPGNLREPLNTGRSQLATHIRERNGNARKDLALFMFIKIKQQVYDQLVERALREIKADVDAEYQALYMTGDAKAVRDKLLALGERLQLQLVRHCDEMYEGFSKHIEAVKGFWARKSIAARKVDMYRRYLAGYTAIETSILRIQRRIGELGLNPPKAFNLTGYLDVDAGRIENLESAYIGAVADARKQTVAIWNAVSIMPFQEAYPCVSALFKDLAHVNIRLVNTRDWALLMDEWAGRKSAAEQRRDDALQRTLDRAQRTRTAGDAGVLVDTVTLPLEALRELSAAYEEAYAWANVKIHDAAQQYAAAKASFEERIRKLEVEHDKCVAAGPDRLRRCLPRLTVRLRAKTKEGIGPPIPGGTVSLRLRGGQAVPMKEQAGGQYACQLPPAGRHVVTARATGFKSLEGEEVASEWFVVPAPSEGRKPPDLGRTIFLSPAAALQSAIRVVVTDAKTGKPVAGAAVALQATERAGAGAAASSPLFARRGAVRVEPEPEKTPTPLFGGKKPRWADRPRAASPLFAGKKEDDEPPAATGTAAAAARSTGADGTYTFAGLEPGVYRVEVRAPCYRSPAVSQPVVVAEPDAADSAARYDVKVPLEPLLSVMVVEVVDEQGNEVPGARVTFGAHNAETGADGTARFEEVAVGTRVPLAVAKDGFRTAESSLDILPERDGQAFSRRVVLRGAIALKVRVVDAANNTPIGGARVRLAYEKDFTAQLSDASGVTRFGGLAPRYTYVSVVKAGYAAVDGLEVDLRAAAVGTEKAVSVRLQQEGGPPMLAFVVTFDGVPPPDDSIRVSIQGPEFKHTATGSRGRVPITKPGLYWVSVIAPKCRPVTEHIRIPGSESGAEPQTHTVTIRLVSGPDMRIEPAEVAGTAGDTFTFTVHGKAPAGARYQWSLNGRPLETAAGSQLTQTFPKPGKQRVRVKLLDGATGKELARAEAVARIEQKQPQVVAVYRGTGTFSWEYHVLQVDNLPPRKAGGPCGIEAQLYDDGRCEFVIQSDRIHRDLGDLTFIWKRSAEPRKLTIKIPESGQWSQKSAGWLQGPHWQERETQGTRGASLTGYYRWRHRVGYPDREGIADERLNLTFDLPRVK